MFSEDSPLNSSVFSWFVLTFVIVLIRVNSLSSIIMVENYIAPNILSVDSYVQNQKPVYSQQI